jgi:hypothetical protein
MNTIYDRIHYAPVPLGLMSPLKSNPTAASGRSPRVILALMALAVTALASPMPVRAALVEASLSRVADPSGPAKTSLDRPGAGALDWLAGLGLDGARGPLAGSTQQRQVAAAYGQLPLSFEANVGQSDQRVRFLARGPGYTLFLTASAEAVLVSGKGAPQVARMGLAGANPRPDVCALEERAAKSYYFIGNDPARWRGKVANYGRVRYQAVYPGIDLVYYGNQRQLEYDLVVAPGADPSRIQLSFPEARQLHLNPESGDVEVAEAGGEVCLHKPVAYQVAEGQQRVAIEAHYALAAGNRIELAVGPYDATRPLIIDPVLVYSTYLGGSKFETGQGIAVDAWGNAYVTGRTESADFPLVNPLPANSVLRGVANAFVSKLTFDAWTATLSLAYSTYLGGENFDEGFGIAVDAWGNAYVTGVTSSPDFPLAHPLPTNSVLRGAQNAFVSKLSFDARTDTLSLAYSTYLGGNGRDFGLGIAVDASGNAYVTGFTQSSDFPLAHPLLTNSVLQGGQNVFVSKLSFAARTATLALAYSTYLGGSGGDAGLGIATDAWGNAYVTGQTRSADFPLAHPLLTNGVLRGDQDAFVSKLSFAARTATLSLAYSTYLGGNDFDAGDGIAVDAWGNAYVTGDTFSSDFPLVHPLPNGVLRGEDDAFVSKLSFAARTATLALAYSTYLGGSGGDVGLGIAVDAWGNAYVTGQTQSADFPLEHPLLANSVFRGVDDAFVSKLSFDARTATLSLAYSTYLGGSDFDSGRGIAVDAWGNAYVTGQTESADFPLAHPLPANSVLRGGDDAFVVKIRTLRFEDKHRDGHDADDDHNADEDR